MGDRYDLAKIRAVGNITRLRILEALSERPWSWLELHRKLRVNPNTLNFHLHKLVAAGVVKRTVRRTAGRPGRAVTYEQTAAGSECVALVRTLEALSP